MDPISLTDLLILSLAVWRVASLLVREEGPFRMFVWLRERAGIGHDADWNPYIIPDRFFAKLLGCVWCTSLWVAVGFAVLFFIVPDLTLPFALILALSASAILLDSLVQKLKR